jgi:hypothetical protein
MYSPSIFQVEYNVFSEVYEEGLWEKYLAANINLAGLDSIPKLGSLDSKYDLFIMDNEFFINIAMVYVRKGGFLIVKLLRGETKRETIVETFGEKFTLVAHKVSATHEFFMGRKVGVCKDVSQSCGYYID